MERNIPGNKLPCAKWVFTTYLSHISEFVFNNHLFVNSHNMHPINSKLNAYLQNSNSQHNQMISSQSVFDRHVLVEESQLMFLES